MAKLPGVEAIAGDANDRAELARLWAGHDAAVSSIHFLASDTEALIGAARDSGVSRYLVVGGAGSLEVAPGVRLVTTPTFPPQYKAEAEKGGLPGPVAPRKGAELDLSVAVGAVRFRQPDRQVPSGDDQLPVDSAGKSWISFDDFAVAMADEIERSALSGHALPSVINQTR